MRWWIVLAGLTAVVTGVLSGSGLALAAGGMFCVACSLALGALDGQRKRGRTRR
jgi:hypothetical protein